MIKLTHFNQTIGSKIFNKQFYLNVKKCKIKMCTNLKSIFLIAILSSIINNSEGELEIIKIYFFNLSKRIFSIQELKKLKI